MPIALFAVITAALLLNKRVEKKLVSTVEQKEFQTRDVIILIVFIAVVISVIAYTSMVNPGGVLPNILLILFLSSYTMLLFTFSYAFTNLTRIQAQLISVAFGFAGLIIGLLSFIGPLADSYSIYRAIAFFAMSAFCFGAAASELRKTISKSRWYVAAQPPAIFVLLFIFFAVLYNGAVAVWFPGLLDVFGFVFAILIILYLSSLFSWKTVLVFAAFLPILDIILVFSGPMVTAAKTFTGLGLPVLVYLPKVPLYINAEGAIQLSGLGLGDFFFAGLLVVQTLKKFGQKTALISAFAIALSFGVWEAFLPEIDAYFGIGGFPATVCIMTGWLPIIAWKVMSTKDQSKPEIIASEQPVQPPATQPL